MCECTVLGGSHPPKLILPLFTEYNSFSMPIVSTLPTSSSVVESLMLAVRHAVVKPDDSDRRTSSTAIHLSPWGDCGEGDGV